MDVVITAGALATFIGAVITLVRMTVAAERRRADDWRTAAQTSSEANRVLSGNIDKLIGSVEQLATSQREVVSLLQALTERDRRGAA
jgi:hypothetical protein